MGDGICRARRQVDIRAQTHRRMPTFSREFVSPIHREIHQLNYIAMFVQDDLTDGLKGFKNLRYVRILDYFPVSALHSKSSLRMPDRKGVIRYNQGPPNRRKLLKFATDMAIAHSNIEEITFDFRPALLEKEELLCNCRCHEGTAHPTRGKEIANWRSKSVVGGLRFTWDTERNLSQHDKLTSVMRLVHPAHLPHRPDSTVVGSSGHSNISPEEKKALVHRKSESQL